MVSQSKTLFDFDHAEVGQPGPDGTPITAKYLDQRGIPTVETRPKPGVRNVTVPLSCLYRRTLVDVTPPPPREPETPKRRPAKMARMLAQANELQGKLDRGEYRDQREAAAALGMTPSRITRLLDLALLAPDIQEEVLFLEAAHGNEPVTERTLREVVRHSSWTEQRRAWKEIGCRGARG